jgi:NAD(P)-dependent dehydrogenase (short-subunit alcohol dehydrogenase family)
MNGDMTDQVAVITGGAGQVAGLGRGLVRGFAARGMKVAILDIDHNAAEVLLEELRAEGVDGLALKADVMYPETLFEAAHQVAKSLGSCNVLCAHVGGGGQGRFAELSLDEWRRAMDLMVTGTVATVQAFLPLMRRSRGMRNLVLTSSVAAIAPGRYQGPYRAAKASVMSIGETLALELGDEGITTTIAFPSGMLHPDLLELGLEVTGAPVADPEDTQMAIAAEMIKDPSDLATGEDAAAVVVEAVLCGRRYVITHGKTVETAYRERAEEIQHAFDELAARSYSPVPAPDRP